MTSSPRTVQKMMSFNSIRSDPRIQNHWTRCRNHVTTNVNAVASTSALRITKLAKAEIGGIVEDLQHEVLPVDVDPPPEVREARRQEIPMMRLREVESEQVKHADDEVEVPRDAHVQQEGRQRVNERDRPDGRRLPGRRSDGSRRGDTESAGGDRARSIRCRPDRSCVAPRRSSCGRTS